MIDTIGLTPGAVGNALASPIQTPLTSCSSPRPSATESLGSPVRSLAQLVGEAVEEQEGGVTKRDHAEAGLVRGGGDAVQDLGADAERDAREIVLGEPVQQRREALDLVLGHRLRHQRLDL